MRLDDLHVDGDRGPPTQTLVQAQDEGLGTRRRVKVVLTTLDVVEDHLVRAQALEADGHLGFRDGTDAPHCSVKVSSRNRRVQESGYARCTGLTKAMAAWYVPLSTRRPTWGITANENSCRPWSCCGSGAMADRRSDRL